MNPIIIIKIKRNIAPANGANHPEIGWLAGPPAGMEMQDCGATVALTQGLWQ